MIQPNWGLRRGAKTVLLVDDHPIVRRGVRALVEGSTNLEVVGEASNGLDAIERVQETAADIVVMDLSMPRLGGLDALIELRQLWPNLEILVLTMHQSEQALAEATEAGARGYVCKTETDHIVPALEAIARGQPYFSPSISQALAQSSEEAWDRRPLTARERQVVALVAQGHSNKSIARRLNISIKTTETHRASAMRKTGTNSVSALTLYAARNGLVDV